jgi:hypothetical protein
MDSQVLGLIGFAAMLGFGLWLMFGRLGNKKASGHEHHEGGGNGSSAPD